MTVLVCCLGLAACGTTSVRVRALAPVNVDGAGDSRPVKMRIYALRDDARFNTAQFQDLWARDRQALGDDRLADPKTVVVPPGRPPCAPIEVDLGELPKGTRFVGVMALIQQAESPDRRRAAIPVDEVDGRIIDVFGAALLIHQDVDCYPLRDGRVHGLVEPPVVIPAEAKSGW